MHVCDKFYDIQHKFQRYLGEEDINEGDDTQRTFQEGSGSMR